MGIKNLKPFLNKKGIGTKFATLRNIVGDSDTIVDVLGCIYMKMVRFVNSERIDKIVELESILTQYFSVKRGLQLESTTFIFDGRLHDAKWATKTQRCPSEYLNQVKVVSLLLILGTEDSKED
jgi:hypothetical protein